MTLEVLFARAHQSSTFLQLCVIGLACGVLLHASVPIHRHSRFMGAVWDVVCCAGVTLVIAWVLLLSGAGVRLYGLLGLAIGMALYMAGVWQAVRCVAGWLRKHSKTTS